MTVSTPPASRRGTGAAPRLRRHQRRVAAVVVGGVMAVATTAEPTGSLVLDVLWCAAVGALAGLVSSYARRGPVLLALVVAALSAANRPALALAALGVVAAAALTRDLARNAPFLRGLAGAAAVCSLLAGSGEPRAWWVTVPAWLTVVGLVGVSGLKAAPKSVRHRFVLGAEACAGLALVVGLVAGFGMLSARRLVDRGTQALDRGLEAARAGDVDAAREHLGTAARALEEADGELGRWGAPLLLLPGAAQNLRALTAVLGEASDTARSAAAAAGLADADALQVTGGRIDLAAVQELCEPLDALADDIQRLLDETAAHHSEPLVPMVRNRLDRVAVDAEDNLTEARRGAAAAAALPDMLGLDEPQRYLVLFTSPAEARGRFGFPGAYAVVEADDGQLRLVDASPISDLFGTTPVDQSTMPLDQVRVAPYVGFGPTREWRSVTIPPDFPTVAALARELWRQTGDGGDIDGVLQLDPSALAALVEFTGPLAVEGVPGELDAEDLERFLLLDQYLLFEDDPGERKDALAAAAETVFTDLLLADLPGPRGLADTFGPLVREDHFHLATFDPDSARFLADLGADGRFDPPAAPDGLIVSGVNSGGNKLDAFLERTITYEADVGDDRIEATATITLTNDVDPAGLPDYVVGSALLEPPPTGTNRMTVVIWSALPVDVARIDGSPVTLQTARDGGWWLSTVLVDIAPGATRELRLTLAGDPVRAGDYGLEVRPGGGAQPDEIRLEVAAEGEATAAVVAPTVLRPAE